MRVRNPVKKGDRFGRLVVIEETGKAADGHLIWRCACDCGSTCERQTNNLKSRGIKSCGCIRPELSRTHGMRFSREYSSWQAAKARCERITDKDYPRYGGRGIRMCQQWSASFDAFYKSLGERPAGTTLERINPNGNYEPGNCIWATPIEQARSRRRSIYVDWHGQRKHLADVAKEIGITYGAAFMRLRRGKLDAKRI